MAAERDRAGLDIAAPLDDDDVAIADRGRIVRRPLRHQLTAAVGEADLDHIVAARPERPAGERQHLLHRAGASTFGELVNSRPLHVARDRDGRADRRHGNLIAIGDAELIAEPAVEIEIVEVDPNDPAAAAHLHAAQAAGLADAAGGPESVDHVRETGQEVEAGAADLADHQYPDGAHASERNEHLRAELGPSGNRLEFSAEFPEAAPRRRYRRQSRYDQQSLAVDLDRQKLGLLAVEIDGQLVADAKHVVARYRPDGKLGRLDFGCKRVVAELPEQLGRAPTVVLLQPRELRRQNGFLEQSLLGGLVGKIVQAKSPQQQSDFRFA